MFKIGVLFDIDELEGEQYGQAAYQLFFEVIDTRLLAGCTLKDGNTDTPLTEQADLYCIAVETDDSTKIATVKNGFSNLEAKGLLPPASRFLEAAAVSQESLVTAAHIAPTGELTDCRTEWIQEAWHQSRAKQPELDSAATLLSAPPHNEDESPSDKTNIIWGLAAAVAAIIVLGLLFYPWSRPPQDTATPSPTAAAAASTQTAPDTAEAQFLLGSSHSQAGEWEQAIAAYQRAIELDPDYQSAYANLGVAYYQMGQFDLAESQYQKALALNPQDGDVAYNLGALYLQRSFNEDGQANPDLVEQAIAQLEQANKLSPELAEPYFSLGIAYAILGRNDQAITAFETFLERDTGQDPLATQNAHQFLAAIRAGAFPIKAAQQ
jgi:Tfp pilus assembly protein PilF